MRYIVISAVLILLSSLPVRAQKTPEDRWNKKACAVVLTYDDGTDNHLDRVIPLLDSLDLRATFYIPGTSTSVFRRIDAWKAAAGKGHELGNHTLFHPCHGKSKNRKWVKPDYDLDTYSLNRFIDEVRVNNSLLKAIDGKVTRTFAYTCGDTRVAGVSVVPALKEYVTAARTVQPGLNFWGKTDFYKVKTYGVRGQTAAELIEKVKKARDAHAMIIFLFHGVGSGKPLSISAGEHRKFLILLKEMEQDVWIVPMRDVIAYMRENE